ncbi:MAG: M48 family metalloprotease [Spirochaetia bacterium]|nr:M48 family metalloprotease [Spirochaetia bacterium]
MSSQEKEAIQNELQVGRSLAARLAKKYGTVRDENLTKYLLFVSRSIATRSSRNELNLQVGVLATDEVNAFACPGGYIMVTRGLLLELQDESELAFVLAHEISHVAYQHSGQFQSGTGFVSFVSALFAGGGSVVNSAVRQSTGELEAQLLEKGRQRNFELDADRAGMVLISGLGYNPLSGTAYLRRLASMTGNQTFIKTHPPISDRITTMELFAVEQGLTTSQANVYQQRYTEYKTLLRNKPN